MNLRGGQKSMFNLNEEKLKDSKLRIERLHRRYSKYETLTNTQVASKVLDDLDPVFYEDPITEIGAYACLANLNKDNREVLAYLKSEFENWKRSNDFSPEWLENEMLEPLHFLSKRPRRGRQVALT